MQFPETDHNPVHGIAHFTLTLVIALIGSMYTNVQQTLALLLQCASLISFIVLIVIHWAAFKAQIKVWVNKKPKI